MSHYFRYDLYIGDDALGDTLEDGIKIEAVEAWDCEDVDEVITITCDFGERIASEDGGSNSCNFSVEEGELGEPAN